MGADRLWPEGFHATATRLPNGAGPGGGEGGNGGGDGFGDGSMHTGGMPPQYDDVQSHLWPHGQPSGSGSEEQFKAAAVRVVAKVACVRDVAKMACSAGHTAGDRSDISHTYSTTQHTAS